MSLSPAYCATGPSAVLITGAAKRVGRDIALHLAGQGMDVALHYHRSHAEAEQTAADIRALGRQCALLQADLADSSRLAPLVAEAIAALPHCRFLVNNASVFERAPYLEADEASFDSNMQLHLKAPVMLTQAFARRAGAGAAVVNMIDSKIAVNRHGYFYYLLSKKALADFTRMAAVALGPQVRVNGVCPGVVMESVDGVLGEEYALREAEKNPLKRTATSEEVAAAVHHLLTTPGLTGQLLFVDGGASLV